MILVFGVCWPMDFKYDMTLNLACFGYLFFYKITILGLKLIFL